MSPAQGRPLLGGSLSSPPWARASDFVFIVVQGPLSSFLPPQIFKEKLEIYFSLKK